MTLVFLLYPYTSWQTIHAFIACHLAGVLVELCVTARATTAASFCDASVLTRRPVPQQKLWHCSFVGVSSLPSSSRATLVNTSWSAHVVQTSTLWHSNIFTVPYLLPLSEPVCIVLRLRKLESCVVGKGRAAPRMQFAPGA